MIDSGSRDRSVEIARAAGRPSRRDRARRVRPRPHAQPRRVARHGRADLLPHAGRDARAPAGSTPTARRSRSSSTSAPPTGPHLPRPDTSPMIARELTRVLRDVLARRRAGGSARARPFLSNVNACYARACWEEIRFREVAYAEDQAFGADMLAAGWAKVYHPGAAVLHAHDYGALEFMRRYFDEYRGLRESTGHVEPLRLRGTLGQVARRRPLDARAGLRPGGSCPLDAALARAPRRPAGRRSARLARRAPAGARSAGGCRSRAAAAATRAARPSHGRSRPLPPGTPSPPGAGATRTTRRRHSCARNGAAPLLDPVPGMADRERLRIAMVLPPFRRGSGGHKTLLQIAAAPRAPRSRLQRLGAEHDEHAPVRLAGGAALQPARVLRADRRRPCYKDFDAVAGRRRRDRDRLADRASGAAARPDAVRASTSSTTTSREFYSTSIESALAERHLPPRPALHRLRAPGCASCSRALRRLDRPLRARRRARHLPAAAGRAARRTRSSTTRASRHHGAPSRSALAALAELHRRRPETADRALRRPNAGPTPRFPYEHLRRAHPASSSRGSTPRRRSGCACR